MLSIIRFLFLVAPYSMILSSQATRVLRSGGRTLARTIRSFALSTGSLMMLRSLTSGARASAERSWKPVLSKPDALPHRAVRTGLRSNLHFLAEPLLIVICVFHPTEIGGFHPTQNGYFRPMLCGVFRPTLTTHGQLEDDAAKFGGQFLRRRLVRPYIPYSSRAFSAMDRARASLTVSAWVTVCACLMVLV